ncbi:50S ribosomal subunit protein L3 [Candidatus Xenohaliotis californiensis]|uniref:50S ribosomal protein L3 n=1 Tax=Candidatus Xenohaliotis californiensis TaxID=84677 RepID=A0ABM9N8H2_9RICK|nr:50S ribosomal subunit protein L3 [Candidatus Xenohaliotis californiensis]
MLYRVGLYCKKIGCSAIYNGNGNRNCVTLLHLESAKVLEVKESDSWNIVNIGFGIVKAKHLTKPVIGFYQKLSMPLCKKIISFKTNFKPPKVGDNLSVEHFTVGQFVDVSGVSIGKGFAGVMKRHNFSGLSASHGVSISHRSHGSTGQCQDPGRVAKGKKMAGHMGNSRVTVQSLHLLNVDLKNGLLVIKGAVPGAKNSYVIVQDAIKKQSIFSEAAV